MKFILPNPFLYWLLFLLYSQFRQTAIYFLHILENILIQYPCIVFCYACVCMSQHLCYILHTHAICKANACGIGMSGDVDNQQQSRQFQNEAI